MVAPKLVNPDGTLQHSGFRFPGLWQAVLDLFPPPPLLARFVTSYHRTILGAALVGGLALFGRPQSRWPYSRPEFALRDAPQLPVFQVIRVGVDLMGANVSREDRRPLPHDVIDTGAGRGRAVTDVDQHPQLHHPLHGLLAERLQAQPDVALAPETAELLDRLRPGVTGMDELVLEEVRQRQVRDAALEESIQVLQFAVQAVGAFYTVDHRDRSTLSFSQHPGQLANRVRKADQTPPGLRIARLFDLLFDLVHHLHRDVYVGPRVDLLPDARDEMPQQAQQPAFLEDASLRRVDHGEQGVHTALLQAEEIRAHTERIECPAGGVQPGCERTVEQRNVQRWMGVQIHQLRIEMDLLLRSTNSNSFHPFGCFHYVPFWWEIQWSRRQGRCPKTGAGGHSRNATVRSFASVPGYTFERYSVGSFYGLRPGPHNECVQVRAVTF